MKRKRCRVLIAAAASCAVIGLSPPSAKATDEHSLAYDRIRTSSSIIFEFNAPASGGRLELVDKRHTEHASVTVLTVPGQKQDAIREAFKLVLLKYPLEAFTLPIFMQDLDQYRDRWLSSPVLHLPGQRGSVVLGGTETGLGILPPVGSVSAGFDRDSQRHTFRWHEKSQYDTLYFCGPGGGGFGILEARNGASNEPFVTLPAENPGPSRHRYAYVVGFKNGLPTNASHIFASDTEQIEYFYRPFTNGMATNWTGWQRSDSSDIIMEEKHYPDMESVTKVSPMRTGRAQEVVGRCAQLLKTETPAGRGGMYRFFIAQTPGRVYRPALRFHIVEEAPKFGGEWSFETMMGTLDPGLALELDNATRVLTGDYWQELRTRGSQIVTWKYDHTMERNHTWQMNQTGAEDTTLPQKDILLGKEKTAVFFCVRLSGHKPSGVAMDGVRLVDVTDGFLNAHHRETWF